MSANPTPDDIFLDAFNRFCQEAGKLRARGRDEDEIRDALRKKNLAESMPLSMRRIERIARWISEKPGRSGKNREPDSTIARWINEARNHAASKEWRGVFARNCLTTFGAVTLIMEKTGTVQVTAACREIAELTGLSHTTTTRALAALTGQRHTKTPTPVLLKVHHPRRAVLSHDSIDGKTSLFLPANVYTLAFPRVAKLKQSTPPQRLSSVWCSFATLSSEDAFRGRRGLPRSRVLVLRAIEENQAQRLKELSAVIGLCARTVGASLADLAAEQLIEKRDGFWHRTNVTLDEVARRRGSAGAAEHQRQEHQRQRETVLDMILHGRGRLVTRRPPAPSSNWSDLEEGGEKTAKLR